MNKDCKWVYSHNSTHDCEKVSKDCDIGFNTKQECYIKEMHRLEKEICSLNKRIDRDTAMRNSFIYDITEIEKKLKELMEEK